MKPLQLLHLEDDLSDRELVHHALATAQWPCEFTYAATRLEFQTALKRQVFDLILADFTLPGFDGLTALYLAREQQPETPCIFVSGTMSEEQAIASLEHGATDYVLKRHLERLKSAVHRARREVEERTRRQVAEEALKASETFLQSLVENLPFIVYRKDARGRLIFGNRHYCERLGRPLADLIGKTDFDLFPPDLARQYWADSLAVMETQRSIDKVEVQIKPDGQPSWIHIFKVPVIDDHQRIIGTQGMYWDVTEHKKAEEALYKSEQRFREMAENIRDVFWITNSDGSQLLYVSPAYEQIWGRPAGDLYRQSTAWIEAILAEDRERVLAAQAQLAKGEECRIEYRIARPDGGVRWVEDRGYPVPNRSGGIEHVVGVVTDITERKELETQLLQAQKMEAIGQLAGGVAHDFNNILTVINGYAGLMLEREDRPAEDLESLKQIFTAGERAANLTRQLLVFSRKQVMHRQPMDLNAVIDEAAKLLGRVIGEHVRLELALGLNVPLIEADASMMEQIFMNLAVNARDAMPRGGRMIAKTEAVEITEVDAKRYPDWRAGKFVCLSVEDSGCGIPPEILPRIFEPFFTTKEAGKGTGLGLATVFGIAKEHRGWIAVESKVGVGTIFKVFLPAASHQTLIAAGPRPEGKIDGGKETILLVEDETAVREFAAAVLRKYGYRVLQASSGAEALETWKWHAQRIALLLTDMVMPDSMTGLELAGKLRAEKPALKVILASGYSSEMMGQFSPLPPGSRFLHKPYHLRTLAKTVRDILDDRTPPPITP